MRRGVPVVVLGDGTSFWTLTHSRDFAVASTGLLGHPAAIGNAFTITSDEALTWDAIAHILGDAVGATPEIAHISSETIAREIPDWYGGLVGDKAHSLVFDNSKIKRLVPEFIATTPITWVLGKRSPGTTPTPPARSSTPRSTQRSTRSLARGTAY